MRRPEKIENEVEVEIKPIPEMVRLVSEGLSPEHIAEQIQKDYHQSNRNNESILIGLLYLLSTGNSGVEMLGKLSKEDPEIAQLLLEINNKDIGEYGLEKVLDIVRFSEVVDFGNGNQFDEVEADTVARHLRKRRYVEQDFDADDCLIFYFEEDLKAGILPRHHLDDSLEEEFFVRSATFGASEPTYLELMGPLEIIKIRAAEQLNALLLGSYGRYSAEEFRKFNQKISPKIRSHVIDKYEESLKPIVKNREKIDYESGEILQASASELPYADNSMDYVYTNHLFGFLGRNVQEVDQEVIRVFSEAARVLKSGGSFLISQHRYGKFKIAGDSQSMYKTLVKLAESNGFIVDSEVPQINHMIRDEVGGIKIDEYGLAHYEDVLLELRDNVFCARLIKI